jgi:hypothetical protein
MTDLNEQLTVTERPIFIDGFADGERAPCASGVTNFSFRANH